MELRHLRYFVMTAEERNISRAAERLFVSQPAVSRQIKDLEEELGMKLFIREPNGMRLTEAGSTALVHAREILRQSNALLDTMQLLARSGSGVVVKVGFLPTALPNFLTDALRRFHRTNKECQVRIFEMSPREQETALRDGGIDLALLGNPSTRVQRAFKVVPIFRTPVAMLVPDDHPLAGRKSVALSEFGEDPFITLHEDQFPERPKMLAELFGKAGIKPEVMLRATGLSELLGLVGGGAGVAVAPADLENLPHHGVVFIPLRKPKKTLTFSAAVRKRERSSELEALLAAIRAGA